MPYCIHDFTFEIELGDPSTSTCDLLIVPVAREDVTGGGGVLASLSLPEGMDVAALVEREHFDGSPLDELLLHPLSEASTYRRLLLVGTGEADDRQNGSLRRATARAARIARNVCAPNVSLYLHGELQELDDALARSIGGFAHGAYAFERHLSPNDKEFEGFDSVRVWLDTEPSDSDVARMRSLARAVECTRNLVNEPANVLDPESLALRAGNIASARDLEHRVFDESDLQQRGFDLVTSVGRGSGHPPRLIHLVLRPEGDPDHRIAFVGKGVTFDTGGNSLKRPERMKHMHADMAGGAAVLGAADALGSLRPEGLEIHFVVPAAENAIGAGALRPQDILRGYGGQTVEIENTDAEGRLLLADAFAYVQETGVDTIVDIATLTGACVTALGPHAAGLFTRHDGLRAELEAAARRSDEPVWPMPLDDRLDARLDTEVADMRNAADDDEGGAITAALFLQRWVELERWAHLDIAGPAYADTADERRARGGTGFGVETLVRFALGRVRSPEEAIE